MPEPEIMLMCGGEPPAPKAGAAAAPSPRQRRSAGIGRLPPVATTLSTEVVLWTTLLLALVALTSCTLKLELASHRHADGDLAATSMGLAPPARWMGKQDRTISPEPPVRPRAGRLASAPRPAAMRRERPPLVVQLAPDLALAAPWDAPPPVRVAGLLADNHAILPAPGPHPRAGGALSSRLVRRAGALERRAPLPAPPKPAAALAPIPEPKPGAALRQNIPLPAPKPLRG